MHWYEVKLALSTAAGVSQDALHIFAGVAGQLALALMLRRRLSHPMPWMVVLGLELVNEWSDLHIDQWDVRAVQWGESIKDVAVTMALPTLLLVLVRWVPRLFCDSPAPAVEELEQRGNSGAMDE